MGLREAGAALCLLALLGLTPPGGACRLSACLVGSLTRVPAEGCVSGSSSISLLCARGEYESFQVVVSSPADTSVEVELLRFVSPSGGEIPLSCFKLYKAVYIHVSRHTPGARVGWSLIPDALVPLGPGGRRFLLEVEAGRNLVLWVDVYAPREAEAGAYHGGVLVKVGLWEARLDVTVAILDFTLPVRQSMNTMFLVDEWRLAEYYGLEAFSRRHLELTRRLYELLAEHRLSPGLLIDAIPELCEDESADFSYATHLGQQRAQLSTT